MIPEGSALRYLRNATALAGFAGILARVAFLGALTTAASCSSGPDKITTPADTSANVVALGFIVRPIGFSSEDVTVHLLNRGGSGAYTIEFWSSRVTPSESHRFWGSTREVNVSSSYDAFLVFHVPVSNADVEWVITRSRPPDSDVFRQSSCVRLGGGTCPPP